MKLARWIGAALLVMGSIGLVGAMLGDGVAVIGRHLGIPLHGSIELVQAFITVSASAAIAYASMHAVHAAVDLVFNYLPSWAQGLAHRLVAVLGFVFVGALIAGSVWIALEYWDQGERTEVLGISLKWLRLFWIGCAVIAAVAILAPVFGRGARKTETDVSSEGL